MEDESDLEVSTPPADKAAINNGVLAAIFGTAALVMILGVILFVFVPDQAVAALLQLVPVALLVIGTFTTVLKVDAVGKQVDGQVTEWKKAVKATGLDKAEIASLKATLAAIQDQQQRVLDAAAASHIQTHTVVTTNTDSPASGEVPSAILADPTIVP